MSLTCWLSLWPRYASCAYAIPAQAAAHSTTPRTIVRLATARRGRGTPGGASAIVLCLMLNRWRGRSACEREPTIANGFAFVGQQAAEKVRRICDAHFGTCRRRLLRSSLRY